MGNTKQRNSKSKTKKRTQAEQADKFLCYQKSVQSPDHEVEFFEKAFKHAFKKKPLSLREDFCGTFAVCCEWVKSNSKRTAVGVDLCEETLQWGRENNLAPLTEHQQQRVRLLEQDVRKRNRPQVDVLAAQNFSFWIFKTRREVIEYFRAAKANLNKEGMMVMDMMGGGDCFIENHIDKRTIKKGKNGFRYDWKQVTFDPITHDASFSISFKFKDGSRLKNAFEYHWRFWSIPEVREMLQEAGFGESHVYLELEDEDGDDSGNWERCEKGESAPCWIAYIVAIK
jgi:predicted RNA methylase